MCKVGDPKHAQKEMKSAMSAVLVTAMLKSWQRPGVVTNATLEEYQRGGQEGELFIVQVANHKTEVLGSAKLIFSPLSGSRCTASTYAHA